MPLDLSQASIVTPEDISSDAAETSTDLKNAVSGAAQRTVSAIKGLAATDVLAPIAAAGVSLARTVLLIMSLCIAALIIYLFAMEYNVGNDIKDIYKQVLNPNKIGGEAFTLGQFEKFLYDLQQAKLNPEMKLDTQSLSNINSVESIVKSMKSLPSENKNVILGCSKLPEGNDRVGVIENCVIALKSVRDALVDVATSASDVQTAQDFATKVNDQRAAFHTFWIQVAQLILLNLLLPLVTGLFGYVFGTQQTVKSDSNRA